MQFSVTSLPRPNCYVGKTVPIYIPNTIPARSEHCRFVAPLGHPGRLARKTGWPTEVKEHESLVLIVLLREIGSDQHVRKAIAIHVSGSIHCIGEQLIPGAAAHHGPLFSRIEVRCPNRGVRETFC